MDRNTDSVATQLLILAWRSGDEQAFATLHRRWNMRLALHARRLCSDVDVVADALQDAWLAIARGLHRLEDPERFPAWARGIVTRKLADRSRHDHRVRRAELAAGTERAVDHALDQEHADDAQQRDEQQALRATLRDMTAADRAVLTLFYLDQLPIGEIAEALCIPRGTVKSRLFHARQRLRQAIERKIR